jgi:asparagine synthase (glutamine-hydrolysing)
MSVQFGRWSFESEQPSMDYLDKIKAALVPYSPDGSESYARGCVRIFYGAFHTTRESRREVQPHVTPSGAVITWDGRLDNRTELISKLRDGVDSHSTDVSIVAAAYEKWGTNSFAKLIGDWALSIWNPNNHSLYLAKDPIGTHHLYYSIDKDHVSWSTLLDPLVLFAGKTLKICEEYLAGWFSYAPAAHLTPYVGILDVPPRSVVLVRPDKHTVDKYWDFDPSKRIRYRTDAEYEQHFRTVFAEAVQHRLRCDRPILAELSGGMDSSSIVCIADALIAHGATEHIQIDTISWFDDTNPDIDERPYFTKVEEKRGQVGCHIDLGLPRQKEEEVCLPGSFRSEFGNNSFAPIPVPNRTLSSELFKQYAACMRSREYRTVLSGIGGSEFMGDGVPTPIPELQDLIATARFVALARRLTAWAVKMRNSRLSLFLESLRGFFPPMLAGLPKGVRVASWFDRDFVRRNRLALCGYPIRVKLFGASPSFQAQLATLEGVRRVLAFRRLQANLLREMRYPFLDRNLLEFPYAIPREQIVRVGQRRSLMKRALIGILPDELLHRKRKTPNNHNRELIPPKPMTAEWSSVEEIDWPFISSSMHIVDPIRFLDALERARRGEIGAIQSLQYTRTLESWLNHLTIRGVVAHSIANKRRGSCSLKAK